MKLTAIVRKERNGNLESIIDEGITQKDFAKELRDNGFRVVTILTDKKIKMIKNKEHDFWFEVKNEEIVEYTQQCL